MTLIEQGYSISCFYSNLDRALPGHDYTFLNMNHSLGDARMIEAPCMGVVITKYVKNVKHVVYCVSKC